MGHVLAKIVMLIIGAFECLDALDAVSHVCELLSNLF